MNAFTFANRNWKEILREPVSYIFCLGVPIVMLIVMSVVNAAIPKEANNDLFAIGNLSGGVAVFSLTFTSLNAVLLVTKDRSGAFLQRLYTSPMKPADYIVGYVLPLLAFAFAQVVVTFAASLAVAAVTGQKLSFIGVLCGLAAAFPTGLLFVTLGVAIGFLLSEKSAPPVISLLVTFGGLLGGVWMDVSLLGGVYETVCRILPFLNATESIRFAAAFGGSAIVVPLLVTSAWAAAALAAAVGAFVYTRRKI